MDSPSDGLATLPHDVLDSQPRRRVRPQDLLQEFRDITFSFRGHCGQITNWLNQPVPWPYYHGLNFVLVIDLLVTAAAVEPNPKRRRRGCPISCRTPTPPVLPRCPLRRASEAHPSARIVPHGLPLDAHPLPAFLPSPTPPAPRSVV